MSNDDKTLAMQREKTPMALGQRGLVIQNHAEMYALAGNIAKTKMSPNGYGQEDVFVALLAGSEFGFSPVRSLHAIPVINGRPTLEGKAMIALIQAGGFDDPRGPIDCGCDGEGDDRVGWCESWRKGWPEPRRTEFTWKQAKKAGLASGNVYQKYGEDMIMWKAVNRHANKYYSDVTHGLMLEVTGQEVYGSHGTTIDSNAPDMSPEPAAPAEFLQIPEAAAEEAEIVPEEAEEVVNAAPAREPEQTKDTFSYTICGTFDDSVDPDDRRHCMQKEKHDGRCDWMPEDETAEDPHDPGPVPEHFE